MAGKKKEYEKKKENEPGEVKKDADISLLTKWRLSDVNVNVSLMLSFKITFGTSLDE